MTCTKPNDKGEIGHISDQSMINSAKGCEVQTKAQMSTTDVP